MRAERREAGSINQNKLYKGWVTSDLISNNYLEAGRREREVVFIYYYSCLNVSAVLPHQHGDLAEAQSDDRRASR